MIVLHSGRKTGRTTALIEMAAEAESKGQVCYIICSSHKAAYAIAQRAKEKGLNIGFPLTYDEFLRQDYYGKHINHFLIDNADHLLQHISGIVPVKAITVEKEELDENS